uniref:Glycoprotein n=1 Tax=Strongyloides venezuelensis TaxID=75913 RepID=A0A0K0EZR9_STRVS
MSILLYFLATSLALVPLSILSEGASNSKYFPSVPAIINETTFPVRLSVNTTSGVVLIKCPSNEYQHTNDSSKFGRNMSLGESGLVYDTNSSLFSWIPLTKKSPGHININCGSFNTNDTVGNRSYEWDFNIDWENYGNFSNLPEAKYITSLVPLVHTKCNSSSDDKALVFTKDKENKLVRVDSSNDNVVYIRKLFYYFQKPKEDEVKEVMEPCAIAMAYCDCPSIILPEFYANTIMQSGVNNIGMVNASQVINVILLSQYHPTFYEGEVISYSKMDFTKNKLINIEGSSKNITSEFYANVYDIVQLTYKCLEASGEYNIITRIYYFEPKTTKHGFEKIAYVKEDTEIQPNCSLTFMNNGGLESITHHGITTTSDKWNDTYMADERFRLKDGYIFLKSINDRVTELKCVYRTPNNKITKKKEFTAGKYVTNPGGGRSIDTSVPVVDNAKLNRNMEEKRRKMSAYHKMVHAYGKLTTHIVIIILIIVMAIVTTILCVLMYMCIIIPQKKMNDLKVKSPNLYYFWEIFTVESFETYCMGITDKKYLYNCKPTFKIQGGEEADVGINDRFDGCLVKFNDNNDTKIKAHYVYIISDNVNYIHCDGPIITSLHTFWNMVFKENIGTIIAIIYDSDGGIRSNTNKKLYWPEGSSRYGDITIDCLTEMPKSIASSHCYEFKMSKISGDPKYFKLYHIYDWREHEIPQSEIQFVEIHQKIIADAERSNILIHSTEGTDSRVYMLTYFAAMYNALAVDLQTGNPLEVIKAIRYRRYGGSIGVYEFAFVVKAFIALLFKNRKLANPSMRRMKLYSSYKKYFSNFISHQSSMNSELEQFLSFVNVLDSGKLYEYEAIFTNIGTMTSKDIFNSCRRFYIADKNKYVKKTRYSDIVCLDSTAVIIRGKPSTDMESFIHANKFVYTTSDQKERKLILCQGPLDDTRDDMLDMIFRYEISLVVVLVKPEEASPKYNKWTQYFPDSNTTLMFDSYFVTRTNCKGIDANCISESQYVIEGNNGEGKFNFTVLNYHGWPDKSIPPEHLSIYELYKRIISFNTDNYIAIHCSAGVGRTGTLALIMYLIDTISLFPAFNPVARLRFLRQHRYGAVQRYNQFVFALLVVFQHYKENIDEMDSDAFGRFYNLAREIFMRDGCIAKN